MQNEVFLLILILFSAIHGLIFASILFFKNDKRNEANRIFATIVFLFSLYLIEYYSAYNNIWPQQLYFITYPCLFFIGPLFYFYNSSLLNKKLSKTTRRNYLLPGILAYLAFLPFYIVNFAIPQGQCPIATTSDTFINLSYIFYLTPPWIFPLFTLCFIIHTYVKFSKGVSKDQFAKKVDIQLLLVRHRWAKNFLIVLFIFFLINSLYLLIIYFFQLPNSKVISLIAPSLLSLIIMAIGYQALMAPTIFANLKQVNNGKKYQTSSINESMAKSLLKEIINFLEKEKAYLNENISLDVIAKETGISKHNVSQVINQEMGVSFFNLLNKYRIEEVKKIILNNYQNLTTQEIAYSVGFNNKVSFYRAFKNVTGESFTDFKKRVS